MASFLRNRNGNNENTTGDSRNGAAGGEPPRVGAGDGGVMPPRRKKPLIFYGWWIVIATIILNLVFGGILFYGFTLVIDPISDEMGWTKTEITAAYLFMGVLIAIVAPILGSAFDRIGPRPLIGFSLTGIGVSMVMLHSVESLPWFYVWFSLANASSVGMWMGTSPAVANWFVRKRGRALGAQSLGFAFAGFMAPLFLWLMDGVTFGGFEFAGVGLARRVSGGGHPVPLHDALHGAGLSASAGE